MSESPKALDIGRGHVATWFNLPAHFVNALPARPLETPDFTDVAWRVDKTVKEWHFTLDYWNKDGTARLLGYRRWSHLARAMRFRKPFRRRKWKALGGRRKAG
jgi:hypothetical protein